MAIILPKGVSGFNFYVTRSCLSCFNGFLSMVHYTCSLTDMSKIATLSLNLGFSLSNIRLRWKIELLIQKACMWQVVMALIVKLSPLTNKLGQREIALARKWWWSHYLGLCNRDIEIYCWSHGGGFFHQLLANEIGYRLTTLPSSVVIELMGVKIKPPTLATWPNSGDAIIPGR